MFYIMKVQKCLSKDRSIQIFLHHIHLKSLFLLHGLIMNNNYNNDIILSYQFMKIPRLLELPKSTNCHYSCILLVFHTVKRVQPISYYLNKIGSLQIIIPSQTLQKSVLFCLFCKRIFYI